MSSRIINYLYLSFLVGSIVTVPYDVLAACKRVEVKSSFSGQTPYDVLYEHPEGQEKDVPGIYVTQAQGSVLAVPGHVLEVSRRFNGILAELPLTKQSNRHEAISVVDGKIVIFSQNTRARSAPSFLTLGSKETPIVDIVTGQRLQLEPVKSLDDVSVYLNDHQQGLPQFVLMSLKQKNILGDGVTLAFSVEVAGHSESKVTLKHNRVFLLNNNFLNTRELSQLVRPGDPHLVISHSLAFSMAQPHESDSALLRLWKEQVHQFIKGVLKNQSPEDRAKLFQNIPVYSLLTGKAVLLQPADEVILNDPFQLQQVVNPIDGHSQVNVYLNDHEDRPQGHIAGHIDYDHKKKQHMAYAASSSLAFDQQARSSILVYINQKLHAIFERKKDEKLYIVPLDMAVQQKPVRKLEYLHAVLDNKSHLPTHYFIVSQKHDFESSVTVYMVQETTGTAQLVRSYVLSNKFIEHRELLARTTIVGEGENAELAFDYLAPVRGKKFYRIQNRKYVPHGNLTKSIDDENVSQIYLEPRKSTEIYAGGLEYRQYDEKGAFETHSGFYVLHKKEKPQFIPGEILIRNTNGPKNPILDQVQVEPQQQSFMAPQALPYSDIAVIPFFTTADKNAKQFELLTFIKSIDNTRDYHPAAATVTIPADFRQLVGAKILPAKRRHRGDFTVLLFFRAIRPDKEAGSRLSQGGVYAVHINASANFVGGETYNIVLSEQASGWLERTAVAFESIKHRVVPDKEGTLYWIRNPELEKDDSRYSVVKFSNPEEVIRANRLGAARLILKHGEDLKEDWGAFSGIMSEWLVYSPLSLKQKYNWFEKALEEHEKNQREEQTTLFPQFEEFLDHLATHGEPPRHTVLIVEPTLKEFFKKTILLKLATTKKSKWNLEARDFYFYDLDPATGRRHMQKELELIRNKSGHRRDVLFADLAELQEPQESNDGNPTDEGDDNLAEEVSSNDKSSALFTLAVEGQVSSFKTFRRDKQRVDLKKQRIPMLLLSTPEEWRALQEKFPEEDEAGIFQSYDVNARFLTAPWSVWPPDSERVSDEVRALHKVPVSQDEQRVFPNLESVLQAVSDPQQSHKHRVILIPEDLKELVNRLILGRWAMDDKKTDATGWTYKNDNLALFHIQTEQAEHGTTQDYIFDNFDAMKGASQYKRVVLLGSLDEVLRVGRPVAKENTTPYLIRDPAVNRRVETLKTDDENSDAIEGIQYPHFLWSVATEGKKIQPRDFIKNKDVSHSMHYSSLFIGTEKEWAHLDQEIGFENKFGLSSHFEVVKLSSPSEDVKRALIEALFRRPEIASLGYHFFLEGRSTEEARQQLIALLVSQTERISRSMQHESTSAFIRTYAQLRRALIEDIELRRTKQIDRFWIQRLFARVFPIPISLDTLSANDPLRKLQNIDEAALAFQQSGYAGPLELKQRAFGTVLSQTRGADDSRPIPSSTILFGGTSTGKTFFFKKLVKFLGLKLYDFTKPNDEEASAVVIDVAKLTETADKAHPETMSVDEAIDHLLHFLSLPQGYRGFILFDDVHKSRSTEVLRKLMTFIQSLFDAKNGLIHVKRLNSSELTEIPVRNLNLYMTLNPTMDREVRDRYVEENSSLVNHVIAALVREDYAIEESVFARWADIINLDLFPMEAKAPTLVQKVRKATQQEYNSDPKFTLISPDVLEKIVQRFPNANAREFLSTATNSLLSLGHDVKRSSAVLVMPRRHWSVTHDSSDSRSQQGQHEGETVFFNNSIESFVRSVAVVRPISSQDHVSQLDLLSVSLEGFRVQMYEFLLQVAQQDARISGSFEKRMAVLSPFLLGVVSNLSEHAYIPLKELQIHAQDLGASSEVDIERVHEAISEFSKGHPDSYFPYRFRSAANMRSMGLDDFLSNRLTTPKASNRLDLLSETARDIESKLRDAMAKYYRLRVIHENPNPMQWIQRLDEHDYREEFHMVAQQILDIYFNFLRRIYDPELQEMNHSNRFPEMTSYDKVRLFLICFEKALTQLPWAHLTHFMVRVLETASQDLSLGQRPEFQNYLFHSHLTPLRTITNDFIFQTARSSKAFQNIPEHIQDNLKNRFHENCAQFLATSHDSDSEDKR